MNRRSFIIGLIAAPAIVKFASIMPVRGIIMDANGPFDKQWFRYAITFKDGSYGEWTGKYDGNGCYDFGDPGVYIGKGDTLSILDLHNHWKPADNSYGRYT